MAKYIDKTALVAEIERKMNLCKQILLRSRTRQDDDYHQGNIEAYEVVISLLDTLEVKEVEEPNASDRGMAEEIIISLKRVEQDYRIDLTKEIEWLRNKVKKGE